MLSQCICYTSKTYQILSPALFQQSLYFPLLIHRIFYLLVSALFFTCFAVLHSSRSFAPAKKWLFSIVTWGIKCARCTRARTYGAGAEYSSCIIFVVYSIYTVGRTCSKKTACLNFLCLLPMVLKTRGLGTGATFMHGSYVAEPRLLAWLRERTVLVKSEHELHAIYRECLKLIFAFTTQSSLSKVRNDNVRKAVPTRGTCSARTAASVLHTQTNPLLRYRTLSQDLHQS